MRITISTTNVPHGHISVDSASPIEFEGWLDLLRILEDALSQGSDDSVARGMDTPHLAEGAAYPTADE
ncbi:MAG: hypothetical protein ACREQM_03880 [Candidatus Dormibacteraceae bacterium]